MKMTSRCWMADGDRAMRSTPRRGSSSYRLLAVMIGVLAFGELSVAQYSQLIVVGDSLSDTGNVFSKSFGIAGRSPYFQGRFTNGPTYVDYLSDLFGFGAPQPSTAGGSNYAHGAARVAAPATAFTDSLVVQSTDYLNSVNGTADPHALYVVFGGGNDVRDTSLDMVVAGNQLVGIVDDLIAAGASTVVVPNVPDLGQTPEVTEFNQGAGAASTARTLLFNDTVSAGINSLSPTTPAEIIEFDLFGLFEDIIADASTGGAQFGFTNVTADCWEGGPANGLSGFGFGDGFFSAPQCANPDEYLFWDIVHPTTAAHELFAQSLFAQLTVVDADFDGNGALEVADLDLLVAEIAGGGGLLSFDLTGDGQVNLADRDAWLAEAGATNLPSANPYLLADANLDGTVDGVDFLAWNDAKFTMAAAWSTGDFNADGVVDGSDFLLWNDNKFLMADALLVPEPTALGGVWLVLAAMFWRGVRTR
ncbi:MAG: SGNH/GDSL hydrolase family protein [Planctomycetota bacterium]